MRGKKTTRFHSALNTFARQLPLLLVVIVIAGWVARTVAPGVSELGDHETSDPQLRLRHHVQRYADVHWDLTIEDPESDVVLFTSAQWSLPTTWVTMSHYTALVRAKEGDGDHDIFRFDMSATPKGVPVRFGFLRRLTSTEDVDESNLVAGGPLVAFSNFHAGRHDSVVVIDLTEEPPELTESWPTGHRVMSALTNLQRVGQLRGIDRAQYLFAFPPAELRLSFTADRVLEMDLGGHGRLELNLAVSDEAINEEGTFSVRRIPKIQEPFIFVVTDLVRNLSFIGPERMAVVQRVVYDLADYVRRQEHNIFGTETEVEVSGTADPLPIPEEPRDGFGVLVGEEQRRSRLPLERTERIVERRHSSEGQWAAVEETVPVAPEAVPLFYQTYIRVDEERDYAVVHATVWDPDRVRLGIRAGTEEPVPTTSGLGTGRIPRDGDLPITRLVAAFNGGFQTVHGTYGLIEDRTVLIPPRDQSATVIAMEGDRVAFGRWHEGLEVPGDVIGLRQNLRPLVEDGRANPDNRPRWGWALGQTRANLGSPLTTRTGLCRMENGALGYFFGTDVDGQMLANGMVAAGCDFGIHLDMNQGHTGFEYYAVRDAEGEDFDARTMRRGMGLAHHPRYIGQDTRDFFYLMLRPNRLEEGLEAACEGQEAPRYTRLTSSEEPLGPDREILLAPARVVHLVDRPLCAEPDVTVDVVRMARSAVLGRLAFYREVPDRPTLARDQLPIMIPIATREAPDAVGLDRNGRISFLADQVEPIPAFRLESEPPGERGVGIGVDSQDDLYLVFSANPDAMAATMARLSLQQARWIPISALANPVFRFDDGRVRTLPAGGQPAVPNGFVLWLDLEGERSISMAFEDLFGRPIEEQDHSGGETGEGEEAEVDREAVESDG